MPHEEEYCIPMDTPLGIVQSWIAERIKLAKDRYWPAELDAWANCVHSPHDSNHYNEPPIPVLLGFIAEAAASPEEGGVQMTTAAHRQKLLLWGLGISATHRNPQAYMSRTRCPNLEPYVIPSEDDPS